MFLIRLILFSFFITNLNAMELSVSSHKAQYKLDINDNLDLTLKGHQINLSIIAKKCNKHILSKFKTNLDKIFKRTPLRKNLEVNDIKFIIENKKYFENLKSRRGYFLINLPKEIHRMKIEEKFRCKK